MNYTVRTIDNYPDNGEHQEVVWELFMPFAIACFPIERPTSFAASTFFLPSISFSKSAESVDALTSVMPLTSSII